MTATSASSYSTRYIRVVCFAICVACLIFAARGLFTGYSYWLDELYSVSASSDTWRSLYKRWALEDVHPPLYYAALKAWISIFGPTEVATRILSLTFSIATLGVFSFDAITTNRWRRVIALLLIGLSPLFAYYSQEARSYSLMLALSSVVTLTLLELRSKEHSLPNSPHHALCLAYYFGALLLSLTHYFGWIYVFILSIVNIFENRLRGARARSLVLIAIISLWPIWHVLVGSLGAQSGGNAWIKVSPAIAGTVKIFLSGCLPFLSIKGSTSFLITWSLLVALVLVSGGSWHAISPFLCLSGKELSPLGDESKFSLISISLVVGTMAFVDLHTPLSTTRNYIVLLPLSMIVLSNAFVMLTNSGVAKSTSGPSAALLLLVVCLLLFKQSWTDLNKKIYPFQNWKGMAAYVDKSGACSEECFVMGSYGLHNFYFSGSSSFKDLYSEDAVNGTSKTGISLDDQLNFVKEFPDARVLGFHLASAKIPELLAGSKDRICIQPLQSWDNSTFLVLPASALSGKEQSHGMRSCSTMD